MSRPVDGLLVPAQLRSEQLRRQAMQEVLDDLNRQLAPIIFDEKIALAHWFSLLARINESCQVTRGDFLVERLKILLPLLQDAETGYIKTLETMKNYYLDHEASLQRISLQNAAIEDAKTITSIYVASVKKILQNTESGESLVGMHVGDSMIERAFLPYKSQVSRGGAPRGMRPHTSLLAKLAIQVHNQHPNDEWQSVASGVERYLRKCVERGEQDPVYKQAMDALTEREYTKRGEYIRKLVYRYRKVVSKTGF